MARSVLSLAGLLAAPCDGGRIAYSERFGARGFSDMAMRLMASTAHLQHLPERRASHGSVFWKEGSPYSDFRAIMAKQAFVLTDEITSPPVLVRVRARLVFASNCRHSLPLLARQTRGHVTGPGPTSQWSKLGVHLNAMASSDLRDRRGTLFLREQRSAQYPP